jgi:hypothetical protein
MEDSLPLGKWSYILSWIGRFLTKVLPGWILKRKFPIAKCQESITVFCEAVGPELYTNSRRKFAVECLTLKVLNQLPFPITANGFWFDMFVNSRSLAKIHRVDRVTIQPDQFGELKGDADLADNQANILREVPNDSAILHIQGEIQFQTPAGEVKKHISLNTRGFIHR